MGNILVGLARARRHGEQFTGARDVVAAGAAGEQAVMADAMEAVWQDMDEEAGEEPAGRERHGLEALAPVTAVILPLEGDAVAVAGDQASTSSAGCWRWRRDGYSATDRRAPLAVRRTVSWHRPPIRFCVTARDTPRRLA